MCCVQPTDAAIWLVGDHEQLGPVVKSSISLLGELHVPMMQRVAGAGGDDFSLLDTYRSHPSIMRIYNNTVYQGKLREGHSPPSELQSSMVGHAMFRASGHPVLFRHIKGHAETSASHSKMNRMEAEVIIELLDQLRTYPSLKPSDIGVITPYKAQKNLLLELIQGTPGLCALKDTITIDTVHKFQGGERKVIICSTVRSGVSSPFDIKKDLGFTADKKMANVTVSRAQSALIVVGDMKTLAHHVCWNKMTREAFKLNAVTGLLEKDLLPVEQAEEAITCIQSGSIRTASAVGVHPHGYMFICNKKTEPECLDLMLFGLPASNLKHMQQHIQPGTICMLYNTNTNTVKGPFYAVDVPEKDIVPDAWRKTSKMRRRKAQSTFSAFPAQVRVRHDAIGTVRRQIAQKNGGYLSSSDCSDLMELLCSASCMEFNELSDAVPSPSPVEDSRDEKYGHGFLFVCNNQSVDECLENRCFGLKKECLKEMQDSIGQACVCMLYNRDSKIITGPFYADGVPALDIIRDAYSKAGRKHYRAQVRVTYKALGKSKKKLDVDLKSGGRLGGNLLRELMQDCTKHQATVDSFEVKSFEQIMEEKNQKRQKMECHLIELASDSEERKSVQSQCEKQWLHHDRPMPINMKVWKIQNPPRLEERFRDYEKQVGLRANQAHIESNDNFVLNKAANTRRRFHGTKRKSSCSLGDRQTTPCEDQECPVCNIIRSGFKLPRPIPGKPLSYKGLRFGYGIYSTATSSKAGDYPLPENVKDGEVKVLLVVKVVAGKAEIRYDGGGSKEDLVRREPTEGYDSVVGNTADEGGGFPDGEGFGGLQYDELVVYSENAILPIYLVTYDHDTAVLDSDSDSDADADGWQDAEDHESAEGFVML